MSVAICKQTISSLLEDSPPFAKVIALGYQDGPTTGVVACADDTTAYRFDLLGIDVDGAYDHAAWDRGEELRVYGLAPLPPGSFERIVRALAASEPPRWPVWMTGGDDVQRRSERDVIALLEAAGPPRFAVAGPSLLDPFRAAREIEPGVTRPRSDQGWFAWLGLADAGSRARPGA